MVGRAGQKHDRQFSNIGIKSGTGLATGERANRAQKSNAIPPVVPHYFWHMREHGLGLPGVRPAHEPWKARWS